MLGLPRGGFDPAFADALGLFEPVVGAEGDLGDGALGALAVAAERVEAVRGLDGFDVGLGVAGERVAAGGFGLVGSGFGGGAGFLRVGVGGLRVGEGAVEVGGVLGLFTLGAEVGESVGEFGAAGGAGVALVSGLGGLARSGVEGALGVAEVGPAGVEGERFAGAAEAAELLLGVFDLRPDDLLLGLRRFELLDTAEPLGGGAAVGAAGVGDAARARPLALRRDEPGDGVLVAERLGLVERVGDEVVLEEELDERLVLRLGADDGGGGPRAGRRRGEDGVEPVREPVEHDERGAAGVLVAEPPDAGLGLGLVSDDEAVGEGAEGGVDGGPELGVARDDVGDGLGFGGPVGVVQEGLDGVGEALVGVEEALEDGGLGGSRVVAAVGVGEALLRGVELPVEVGAGGFDLAHGAVGVVALGFDVSAGLLGRRGPLLGLGDALGDLVLRDLDAGDLLVEHGAAAAERLERRAGLGDGFFGGAGGGAGVVEARAGGLGLGPGGVAGARGLSERFVGGLLLGLGGLDPLGERFGFGAERFGAGLVGLGLAVEPVERGGGGGGALVGEAGLGLGAADLLDVRVEGVLGVGEGALAVEEGGALGFGLGLAGLELGRPLVHLVAERGGLGFERFALGGEAVVVGGGEGELERAELFLERLVALRLVSLAREAADALLDLVREVGEAGEVGLGGVEAAEGLAAAELVLRDAGGLLEEAAAVGGVLREDVLDHLQLDDGVRARPHPRVHEQVEDVFQPADGPVQEVLRLAGAVEPAADRDVGVLGREDVPGVLDGERDLGEAEGAARGGPVEDDVLHLLRAEQPRALLAEHPPDGVDDVGLPAAVGPDDGGDAGVEVDGGLVGEALEAVELDAAEVHAGVVGGGRSARPGRYAGPRPRRILSPLPSRRPRPRGGGWT